MHATGKSRALSAAMRPRRVARGGKEGHCAEGKGREEEGHRAFA